MDARPDPRQLTYRFCTAFFAELAGHGVRNVVVSPGSRSTPLTLSANAVESLRLWVLHDERAAGFFALGLAKASRAPVALVCTSGTAAANYLPAIVEANLTDVPLIVCTADRPPELQGWGAPQTIDQTQLYGSHVRQFVEVPVPAEAPLALAPRLAARTVGAGGPVHLNWPLREPLEPNQPIEPVEPTQLVRRPVAAKPTSAPADRALLDIEEGLIVAGPRDAPGDDVAALSRATGWPVFADPASQLRRGPHVAETPIVWRADRVAQPDVVVLFGGHPVRKPIAQWLQHDPPRRVVLVDEGSAWREPTLAFTEVWDGPPAVEGAKRTEWTRKWVAADAAIAEDNSLPAQVVRALPDDGILYASNSMAIRYLDRHLAPDPEPLRVLCHRGANGIDGLTSAALGAAAAGVGRVTLLTGDLAFLHDVGGLLAARRLGIAATIVVLDDNGGGIFSLLPIAELGEAVAFRELFHTPHDLDLRHAAALAGVSYARASSADEVRQHIELETCVIHVPL